MPPKGQRANSDVLKTLTKVNQPDPSLQEIIDKRKQRWEQKHDIAFDRKLVQASVVAILASEKMRKEVVLKPYRLIEACFTIVDKTGQDVPFFFNEVQRDFVREVEVRGTDKPYYILKGRQQGFTTLITAWQLARAITQRNFSGFTIADSVPNTSAIFADKAKAVFERLPDLLKPHIKASNAYELSFDKLNATWRIAVASRDLGRSRTLQMIHFSEIATYQCRLADLQAGIGQAATQGAFVVYETTANGYNDAKDLWDSETCNNLFFEWWRTREYREKDLGWLNTQDEWLIERKKWLKAKGLDDEQIAWYCRKHKEAAARKQERGLVCQEYPCFPEEAFQSSSTSVFDADIINQRIMACYDLPYREGCFEYDKILTPIRNERGLVIGTETTFRNIRFVDGAKPWIKIHKEPEVVPLERRGEAYTPYVIGGDTSGTGIDYMTAKVLNNMTGETVATLRVQQMDDDEYTAQIYCLGKYYNEALIAIETNFSRVPHRLLSEWGYTRVYHRQKLGTNASAEVTMENGFLTTAQTKPIIIADLIAIMRDTPEVECDIETLKEMLTFSRTSNGGYGAVVGAHDDLVMALAIAHQARHQQTMLRKEMTPLPELQAVAVKAFGAVPFEDSDNENAGYMEW